MTAPSDDTEPIVDAFHAKLAELRTRHMARFTDAIEMAVAVGCQQCGGPVSDIRATIPAAMETSSRTLGFRVIIAEVFELRCSAHPFPTVVRWSE